MSVMRMTPAEWARKQAANRVNRGSAVRQPGTVDKLRIVLPWPPSVNHSSQPNGNGGKYLTAEHRAFRNEVNLRVMAAGSPAFGPDVRLKVDIHLTPPDRRRRDCDNFVKSVQDALQICGVYADDSQIDELRIVRGDVVIPGEGSAVVTISERVAA